MIPEQLKLSILQSAFQGKLTGECVPNETADDLYQQIQSEKQRLISEKKIKKEKPLPEISADEIPFDIPDNWRWCYVGDLFLHNTGKAQNSSGSTNGIIRKFITTSNLYWGEFDFTKVKEMPFTDTELERCTVKRGDLLVCEGGDCGRSAVWECRCGIRDGARRNAAKPCSACVFGIFPDCRKRHKSGFDHINDHRQKKLYFYRSPWYHGRN